MTGPLEPAVALEPDVAAGVDEHLVDGLVGEQRVERAEPVEPGHRGAHQPLPDVGADERRDPPQVAAHDGVGLARLGLGGPAQLGHEHVVVSVVDGAPSSADAGAPDLVAGCAPQALALVARRRHAAPRSSRVSRRGRRAASSPASTARAIAGSWLTDATTGAPTARSTSVARSARPGSLTSTTPSGRHGAATARRNAR